ncbi:ABC transporter ATP-binding protein [Roseomonas marmotae]|uniref:ABC transporter ATP-binding protein n=1 Tax=Roseomonas marmotae TaxID=2768161 RepID=A0ABS3K7A3_9PROT|nr:ABC transporter ATP-binding protein [Roseomonas marmotae]MBO1073332.1 ABC transporter ATP-binding protein [Roseomonas marmotae]QTI79053.1 ABC transporter ATP-binding protein [Roseomonas marmotae]
MSLHLAERPDHLHGAGAQQSEILVEGLTHRYETGRGSVLALRDIGLSIAPGRFVGLVGPSGCGKSSLLMMMAGLVKPSEGRITVRGAPVTGPAPDRIGVVFQEASLLPWRTALENVAFPLKLRGVPRAEREAKAEQLLHLVGLKGFENRHPHELSGGMKQRVAIARGFCQDPPVLLMDEPFAALDEQTRMTLGDELLRIWDQHRKTVVFVTHGLTEAVYLCDEVVVLSGRPGEVLARIEIDLPRPRTWEMMATEHFGKLREQIWSLIRRQS